jgi:tRNA/rRNA methyltransferase
MSDFMRPENIAIVLNSPRYPENIGAAARAARNMGIARVIVVSPENYDLEKIMKLATHAARDIVENIEVYEDLKSAIGSYNYIAGTTARIGGQRSTITSPSKLARQLVSISQNNRIAILFGPEDRGLTNEDIRYCHTLVNIPSADFSSLNLAQAVMIICYEIHKVCKIPPDNFFPRLATRHELDGMYEQLKDLLVKINYINPENPDYWMNKIRHFFSRFPLRAMEVSIIRGVCRQVGWYEKKCYRDGEKNAGGLT